MSFTPVIVEDPRIGNITSKLDYAIYQGAGNNTYQSYTSNSASGSNISFNFQPPSEAVVVSREVMVETVIKFSIEITNVPSAEKAFSYGVNDALQAFPFNSLISTATVSINNTTISTNLQDIKDGMLKCISQKQLGKYQGTCPTLLDSFYRVYSDGGNQSELNGFVQSGYDKYLQPRGCHPLRSYTVEHYIGGVLTDNEITSTGLTDSWIIYLEVETTEPLFISPFNFLGPNEGAQQGLYGITDVEIVLNIDATMKRFWSSKSSNYTYKINLDENTPFRTNLLVNYLTPQENSTIDPKNEIPYTLMPRYITPITNTSSIPPGQTSTISCQNIQLSKVPDLLIITARKQLASQNCFDSASFFPIENVSINFNNQSGLLSSASKQDLYKMSVRNGLDQSYTEFSGYASTFDFLDTSGLPSSISTIGSVLLINPAYDLSLDQTLGNGSMGQFNLQVNITVKNNLQQSLAPEICIVAVTSGMLTTVAGNSSINSGFITSNIILEAQKSQKMSRQYFGKKVASGLFTTIGNFLKGSKNTDKKPQSSQSTCWKGSRKLVSYIK